MNRPKKVACGIFVEWFLDNYGRLWIIWLSPKVLSVPSPKAIRIVTSWRRITKKAKSLSLSQNATYPAKYQTTSTMKVNFSLSFTFISGVPLKPNAVTMHGQSRDDVWRRV